MANTGALFDQADINGDGVLSQPEFQNFLARNSIVGSDLNGLGVSGGGGGYGSSSFESSAYETSSTGGALGRDLTYAGTGFGGAGYGSSSYESSFRSSVGDISNVNNSYNAESAAAGNNLAASRLSIVQQYETDAQGNFKDSNPQLVRRPAQGGPVAYTQNIKVRFLQPPAVPPPGPLIIQEVRPPQPPAPPPLVVRQRAPPLPQPPPLVLRERPPPTPASVASQTVIRNLAAIQVPPRSVVIERLPPAPAKPRDIIIERWIPYGQAAQRKTIVRRAEAAKVYQRPRNVIIQYDSPQVRVIRQFQRLGVTPENPQAYIQRYGASLFDAQTLVQQARAAGVVEDISPPAATGSSEFVSSSSSSSTGAGVYEGSSIGGLDISGGGGGGAQRASFYESSSYSGNGDVSGLAAGFGGGSRVSSYDSSSYNLSAGGADAAFAASDVNNDGVLSQAEFRNAVY